MKALKKILAALLIIIGVLLVISVFLPSNPHIQRALVMSAPPQILFEQVNVLKNWEGWSPWLKMEPDMKLAYNDKPSGTGASYSWVGHKMGEGSITITDCKPNQEVITLLDFKQQGQATGGFNFLPTTGGTEVVWYFDMSNGMNPIKKYMSLIMKGMMEKSFDEGLASIKHISDSIAALPPPAPIPAPSDTTVQQ